ncbi:MAG: addiction module toxin, RelE/StbE family [Segetibacter sp.]|nr:addiction module toxin, RelE/StbE family [Segetibacter sp.]
MWPLSAQDDRKEIFTYWNNRNKSKAYSKKLHVLFNEAIKLISKFPQIGSPTEIENIRIKM